MFGKVWNETHRGWQIVTSLNDSFDGEGAEAVAHAAGLMGRTGQGATEDEAAPAAQAAVRAKIDELQMWSCSLACWKCGQGDGGTTVLRTFHVVVPDAVRTEWVEANESPPCPECGEANTVFSNGGTFWRPSRYWEGDGWKEFNW
jgi:hypothetical protein